VVNSIEGFKGTPFVSVDSADKDFELDLDQPEEVVTKGERVLSDQEKTEIEAFIKEVLKERVQEVKFSDRLVSSPAIVTSILTPHMRKMMKQLMAGKEDTGMNNVPVTLELSAKHHIVTTLYSIKDSNEPVARIAVEQLYDNACIAAGTLDDPRTLLTRLNKVLEMFIYQGAGFDYASNEYIARSNQPEEVTDGKEAEAKDTSSSAATSKFEETTSSSQPSKDTSLAATSKFEETTASSQSSKDTSSAASSKFEETTSSSQASSTGSKFESESESSGGNPFLGSGKCSPANTQVTMCTSITNSLKSSFPS